MFVIDLFTACATLHMPLYIEPYFCTYVAGRLMKYAKLSDC